MRTRPVIPIIGRRVMVPWRLGDYAVPADTPVAMSILLLHHREDLYPDPFAFRPERWLDHKPGTYEWIPFGGGIRRCLGAALAMAEQRVVLDADGPRARPRGRPPGARARGPPQRDDDPRAQRARRRTGARLGEHRRRIRCVAMGQRDSSSDVLSARALNRATLARQRLLRRHAGSAIETIEHLAGMQAQAPNAPYVGLWTRLDKFATDELAELMNRRKVVRAGLMRATIHLVSAADCLAWRPLVQVVFERTFRGDPARRIEGAELDSVIDYGRSLLEQQPRTRADLGRLLAERFPEREPDTLSRAVAFMVPTLQVPPRGVWSERMQATLAPIETWLERPLDRNPDPEGLVMRYLGAFGPATTMDVQAWCRLTRLGDVIDRLRPKLRTFRDEHGRELFDLPAAPRPDPDTPAPPRFLPEYDNLLLSHKDRTRVNPDGRPVPLFAGNGGTRGMLLVDGLSADCGESSARAARRTCGSSRSSGSRNGKRRRWARKAKPYWGSRRPTPIRTT